MPGRRRGFSRGSYPRSIVTSIKNQKSSAQGISGTNTDILIAKAVNTPLSTNDTDTSNGCIIKAIWVSVNGCGLGGTGVLNDIAFFLMKNPGDNLTAPSPFAWGTSNEKKFIIRSWRFMAMRNQDGNVPFHWEGWIKIPKRYHRMGTDDTWRLSVACTTSLTGHFSGEFIYKWFR